MKSFFAPASIVVFGVSAKETNLAQYILQNCRTWGFTGPLYAVGSRRGEIHGVTIHEALSEIADPIELAVVLMPAALVPQALEACGLHGVRRVIIETGGFGELSDEALVLEQECLDIAARHSLRLMGPNCIGTINIRHGVALPFGPMESAPKLGDLSFASQSGGVGIHLLIRLGEEHIGMAKFASVGNKLDVNEADLLEYLLQDPETGRVLLYLEGLSEGRRLLELAAGASKPVIVFKASTGQIGARTAQSHTKALSSDDAVVEAAFRQVGIHRVHETREVGFAVKASRLAPMRGNRLAVISRSGGHACIVADAVEADGFELPPFDDAVKDATRAALRAGVIRMRNPLDVGDIFDFPAYARIARAVCEAGQHDGIVFVHTYRSEAQRLVSRPLLEELDRLADRYGLPIACSLATAQDEVRLVQSLVRLPIFDTPEEAVHALRLARDRYRSTAPGIRPLDGAPTHVTPSLGQRLSTLAERPGWLDMEDCLDVLGQLGVVTPRWTVARSADDAAAAADWGPVVLKALAPELLHKTEAGGVELGCSGAEDIRRGYHALLARVAEAAPAASVEQVLVQQEAREGIEVIVGGRQDPTFGPIVLFGLGGTLAELHRDVAIRVAPIDRALALDQIAGSTAGLLLDGFRGRPAADREALIDLLCAVSELLVHAPEVQEIDLNPVRVFPTGEGASALDVRIRVGAPGVW
ncbi:MAG: acetate--CoA ligase family protein [bacterium]